MSGTAPAVRAVGLGKRFGSSRVLRGVDLRLDPGEITLLMGPNGDGKTVLLSCLAGALHPSTGHVWLGDEPVHEARDRLSLLLQDAVGLPALTGPENARFYTALHPASTGRWRDLLERFDMTDRRTILNRCSGGMRRKVELAVALDPDVPVYLLDEPTTALDLRSVHALHRTLETLRSENRTVVMTSHAPLDTRLADRIVFVNGGTVGPDDTPASLIDSLPPVVRVRGALHEIGTVVRPALRGGYGYGSGSELRGFLPAGRTLADLADRVAGYDVTVELDAPTPVDLFEYYAGDAVE